MASAELQKFLEDRLLALNPAEDLSPGSPAQTKFVQPVLTYLGTDPFETDIDKFILDRFAQEFPDIYAGDPGALRDVFINPLRLILEPFKRETQAVRRAQSLIDPSALSDDDADALVANLFDSRDDGGYSSGQARIYFQSPSDQRVEISNRFYSSGGLYFFPAASVVISAETMSFNREGTLFFMDVPVQAESAGSEYNIDAGSLVGVDGISNAVRVTNLRKFAGGAARQDTPSFVAAAESSLTERSLVTRRGATARLNSVFKGDVRAIQVIGAKDPEMQRDLIVAMSPGHAWITGSVKLHDGVAYVMARTIEGKDTEVPTAGDTLYVYLPDQQPANRFIRLRVEELYFNGGCTQPGFHHAYFVRWSDPDEMLPVTTVLPIEVEGGFSKKGTVKITSLPDIGNVDYEVQNSGTHVYGRADIYIRPTLQDTTKAVIDGAYDLGQAGSTIANPHFFFEKMTLSTTKDSNAVTDVEGVNFLSAGVEIGDVLSIEEGSDAGLYSIGDIQSGTLFLTQKLTSTGPVSGLRYRILKQVRINPFETRIVHFPFGDVVQRQLNTTISSDFVRLTQSDLLKFGARVGDTLRVLEGPDVGDYIIKSFDSVLGGQGLTLDRRLTATGDGLLFEVFTALNSIERPLVRVRELLLLDSAKQSTGLTVPPADPVAIVPTGPFSSAKVLGESQLASGYVLPDLEGLVERIGHDRAAPDGDRRYSMGFDTPDGRYISVELDDGTYSELDLRSDSSGSTSFFLATPETFNDVDNYPPISPNPGESLSIKNGPNKGDYLIKNVYRFKYRHEKSPGVFVNAYILLIKIYGTFPVDPLKELIKFLETYGTSGLEVLGQSELYPISFPGWFVERYQSFSTKLRDALLGTPLSFVSPPSEADIRIAIDAMNATYYEWGVPARGVLRTYFREPTLFKQWTGDSGTPTTFSFKTANNEIVKFRPDPLRYTKQEIIPARLTEDALPTDYPRDLTLDLVDPTAVVFTDGSRASIFGAGVRPGDVLSVHEEVSLLGSKLKQAIVQTSSGSTRVTLPSSAGDLFTPDIVGNLLFIEEGDDKGGYRVTKWVDGRSVELDRSLQGATPLIVRDGSGATYGYDGTNNTLVAGSGRPFHITDKGGYLTLYGIDWRWMGSFLIEDVTDQDPTQYGSTLVLRMPGSTNFPATTSTDPDYLADVGAAFWAVTAAPLAAPSAVVRDAALTSQTGTELVAGMPIRVYEATPSDYTFESVVYDAAISGGVVGDVRDGIAQPYRIYRRNERRITSTEMDQHRDSFLCFFDTEVVSLSPADSANLRKDSYLTVDNGTFRSLGYRHAVEDSNFSYSMLEDGFIDLPVNILPVGSADSPENLVRVVGAPIQISYERADLVRLLQNFVDSAQDRVLSASLLARHFLPAYVSYDAIYTGGSDVSVIAKDIRNYIDTMPVENAVDVSEIEKAITDRGGNPDTPTTIAATIYDWDRRMWVEFSEDYLGGATAQDTKVPYNGSPRVTYFIPGTDVSGLADIPSGERIKLTRR